MSKSITEHEGKKYLRKIRSAQASEVCVIDRCLFGYRSVRSYLSGARPGCRLYEESIKVRPEFFSDYEKVECPDGIGYGLVTQFRKV